MLAATLPCVIGDATAKPIHIVRPAGLASLLNGLPQAQRIHETFEPRDVAVIGLHATFEHHAAISTAMLKAFIQEYRLRFPIALDEPNNAGPIPLTMERYQMRGTPSLILIDRQGFVRKHAFGPVDDLRFQPSRMRSRLPVLPDGVARREAESHSWRNRRAGLCGAQRPECFAARRSHQPGIHGHG